MTDDLTPVLQQLPEPTPPSTLTATVMARIAREAELKAPANQQARVPLRREQPGWLWAVVGAVLALGVSIFGWSTSGMLPDITSARIGFSRVPLMPLLDAQMTAVLGVAFVLYLVGIFSPLSRGRT